MALHYVDGFDTYTSLTLRGWFSPTNAALSAGNGRFGSASLRLTQAGAISRALPSHATYIIGSSFRMSALPPGEAIMHQILDAGTGQVGLYMTATGKLRVKRGTTQIGSDGPSSLLAATTYYIETKIFLHDSTGTVTVRVNGVDEIVLTGQDTKNTANAFADTITFYCNAWSSGNTIDRDDLVIMDGSGSTNNDLIGDVRVEALYPNGNGTTSGMTGSDGNSTDNYLLVDETTPNDDTDYVQASVVDTKDTYAYANLAESSGTVFGVQIIPHSRKTEPGIAKMVSVARLSGTEADSAVKGMTDTYAPYLDMRETKPGGGAWSISDVNSAEFGVKISS